MEKEKNMMNIMVLAYWDLKVNILMGKEMENEKNIILMEK